MCIVSVMVQLPKDSCHLDVPGFSNHKTLCNYVGCWWSVPLIIDYTSLLKLIIRTMLARHLHVLLVSSTGCWRCPETLASGFVSEHLRILSAAFRTVTTATAGPTQ